MLVDCKPYRIESFGRPSGVFRQFIALLAGFTCCGCVSTAVTPDQLPLEYRRLVESNSQPIEVTCSSNLTNETIGRQFLFIFIPFGRVTLTDSRTALCGALVRELAERGYRPTLPLQSATGDALPRKLEVPRLDVTIDDLTVFGFDLLFTRRVSADATLSAFYSRPNGITDHATVDSDEGEFRRYAFETDLRELLDRALSSNIRVLFDRFGLAPNPLHTKVGS